MDALSLRSLGRRLARWHVPLAPRLMRKLELVLFSAYLPEEAEIGEGTILGYGGMGVFIHPQARIGRSCLLSQFTSIGGMGGKEGAPTLGNYVRIGTGARILGPVHIGDFAVVGANSVVVRDVPAGTVVFGIPARVVRTLSEPVMDYERETGLRVSPEDRRRAPRPQRRNPTGVSMPGRNVLRPGEDPGLFDTPTTLLAEAVAPVDEAELEGANEPPAIEAYPEAGQRRTAPPSV